MSVQIFHGDVLYSKDKDNLAAFTDSFIIVKDGIVEDILPQIPRQYKNVPVADHKDGVIIPAFSDLHVHASQYTERGLGMDCLLERWLNDYTFPQEAMFKNTEYAERVYDAFVKDLILNGTFHVSAFATIHNKATDILFEKLEKRGLYGYVGKVNMDANSPDYLCETTEQSIKSTEEFLWRHEGGSRVKPIITPRFAPTCSPKLMGGLGELGRKYKVGVQTHVVESKWEAREALRLFETRKSDSEIYLNAGLLDNGPNIFAHVIFPTEHDMDIMRKYNCTAVHCPDATTNVIAGIMPLQAIQSGGVNIALGSDVGGGHHLAVYKQVARAVQLSKLKEFYEPRQSKTITFANAFYCATKAGGSVFRKIGRFEKGCRFNALVIDNIQDKGITLTPAQKVERFCYIGDDRNIAARYIDGNAINI